MRPLVRLEVTRLGVPLGTVGKVAPVHPLSRQLLLTVQLNSLHLLRRSEVSRGPLESHRRSLLLPLQPHHRLRRESDQLDDGGLRVLHGAGGGDGGGDGGGRLVSPDDMDLTGRALGVDDRDGDERFVAGALA